MSLADLRITYADLLSKDVPLDSRIRCLYVLKENDKSPLGADILAEAVDTTDSVLLQHELVYNIGQFRFPESIPRLREIVEKESYDVVTRHEALEALGAIAEDGVLPFLYEYAAKDGPVGNCPPLRESAVLAICRIEMKKRDGERSVGNPDQCQYVSVDPSPAFDTTEELSLEVLETILATGAHPTATARTIVPAALGTDEDAALIWNRYRAMFTLRNLGSKDAAIILGKALRSDTSSCLFRHEIAFVLGQMEHPASEPFLAEALADEKEHSMVRHEAAEAIGALAEKHSFDFLQKYASHKEAIVRDSCVVALDMHTYWSQYKKASQEGLSEESPLPKA
jgi:deoxyhypusine monooxygenase